MNEFAIYFIAITGIINLIRMAIYLVSSDIYNFKQRSHRKRFSKRYIPIVSVIVPAYNESATIERCLSSLTSSNYPAAKLEILVVNDGSTDNTAGLVRKFIRRNQSGFRVRLINQPNSGKAEALNRAIKRYAKGSLIMCLDADSMVHPNAIQNGTQYFRDRNVLAAASNVNILEDGTLFGLAQRFEYLVCYQMKKAQTILDVEYIIGGIGSIFRKSAIKKAGYYDSNTMTEDIDLTMKVIAGKGPKQKLVYAADCVTYTECVHDMRSLVRQRYRWKYGRMQTFLKHSQLFFSKSKRYGKQLTWFMLPFALLQDVLFLLEPIGLGAIVFYSIRYQDTVTLLTALVVISGYILINVWASQHLKIIQRLRLTIYAPAMYFLLYLLSYAEYAALIMSLFKLPGLKKSVTEQHTRWQSPERQAAKI